MASRQNQVGLKPWFAGLLVLWLVVGLLLGKPAFSDTVRLYEVSGSDGPAVVLSQVAALGGAYAQGLGGVVVARFDPGQRSVDVDMALVVRLLHESGAKLGLLDFQGFGRCVVHRTVAKPRRASVEKIVEPVLANIDARGVGAVAVDTPVSVRGLIERSLAGALGGGRDALVLRFEDRDRALLGCSALAGRYEVKPMGPVRLGAVVFRVQAFRGTRAEGKPSLVRLHVSKRVIAVVAAQPIPRGAVIDRRQVRLQEVMVDDAQQAHLPQTALVIGQVASRRVQAGELLTAGKIEMPVVIRKRDRVQVTLQTRGIQITFYGVARGSGSVGEVIEVENMKTKERFSASVVSAGQVVVAQVASKPARVLGVEQSKKPMKQR